VVKPLSPPPGVALGELITFEGHRAAPEPPGNRAGKAFDRVAEELGAGEVRVVGGCLARMEMPSLFDGMDGRALKRKGGLTLSPASSFPSDVPFPSLRASFPPPLALQDMIATYKGIPFMTSKGPVTTGMAGSIS